MTAVDYAGIAAKKNQLVRKGLQGSVFVAEITASAISAATLFDSTSGGLVALPSGYTDIGWTANTGAKFSRKVTSTAIDGWGTNDPLRSDITSDVTTMQVDGQETKLRTISLSAGVDPAGVVPLTNGAVEIDLPTSPKTRYYRVLAVAVDQSAAGEIVMAHFLPRCAISNYSDQSYSNDKDPLIWGMEFTAYQDSTLGFAQSLLFGGEGWSSLRRDMGFIKSLTCSTASSTTLTATTGTFSAADVGSVVSGAGIPTGTTIATFTDATHVVLSAAATATASGVAVTVNP